MKESSESMAMTETEEPEPARRSRGGWRDFWQLHVPLVLVLSLCTFITIVEVRRASEGVWRAWAYMFEWPLIGLFTIWIWHRYRTEGSVTKGFVNRWRDRVASLSAESANESDPDEADPAGSDPDGPEPEPAAIDDSMAARTGSTTGAGPAQVIAPDAQLQAWNEYVEDLRRREPPGAPPS